MVKMTMALILLLIVLNLVRMLKVREYYRNAMEMTCTICMEVSEYCIAPNFRGLKLP